MNRKQSAVYVNGMLVEKGIDTFFTRAIRARQVGGQCERYSEALGLAAERMRRSKRNIDTFSNVVGGSSVVASLILASQSFGASLTVLVAGLTGVVLIFVPILHSYLAPHSPARLEDHALAIGQYAQDIDRILHMNDKRSAASRLTEITSAAQHHLNQARVKWPELVRADAGAELEQDEITVSQLSLPFLL